MKVLSTLKVTLLSLLFTTTAVWACPEKSSCAQHHKYCEKKSCDKKSCDKKSCDLSQKPMCHTAASDAMTKKTKGSCHTKKHYSPFIKKVKHTLKALKLTSSQWSDIKLAFSIYKDDMRTNKSEHFKKSVLNGNFDKKSFIKHHPMNEKMIHQADLLETIFLVLNDKQKKLFPKVIAEQTLHSPKMCHKKSCN